MLSKNIKYFRLKNDMSQKQLAEYCGITPMAISNYENGSRKPEMAIIKKMAEVLKVKVVDFLRNTNNNLVFCHGEFRKSSSLSVQQQEFIRESVEEYFGRFYLALSFVGDSALPSAPLCHCLELNDDPEIDARNLRVHLGLAPLGPIDDLIAILENKGILVYKCNIKNDSFSGMNGFVDNRPYIIINSNMSTERNRSTIAHELAHLFFKWNNLMTDKDVEARATAISGAFLLPKEDAIRELGVRRSGITNDMILVCKEYGISAWLLAKRAEISSIISTSTARSFYILANKYGWKKHEPTRIEQEEPTLFEQIVYRAVSEDEISVQKGAELLRVSFEEVERNRSAVEV